MRPPPPPRPRAMPLAVVSACAALLMVASSSIAQTTAPATRRGGGAAAPAATAPVARGEVDQLRREVEALRRELRAVRGEQAAAQREADATAEDVEKTIDAVRRDAARQRPGTSSILFAGQGTFGFVDRDDDPSTFSAVFRPLVVWRFSERLLFEGKLELLLQDDTDDADVELDYANLSYILNDYATVAAGKFVTPFGLFPDRFYPGKLLDVPLVYGPGGLAPRSDVGVVVRGAFPAGPTEWNYAAWVGNGPELSVDDPTTAGQLGFDNNIDDNDDKSVGGRVGFLPWADLELGASVLYAGDVSPGGFARARAMVYGVDAQYVKVIRAIGGALDVRVEWVWSDVDNDVVYDPTGALGLGPLAFDNDRTGGYAEVSYRPFELHERLLRDAEFVVRYDLLDQPAGAPGGFDDERLTVAVLYWLTPTTSLRAGYVFDNATDGAADQDAVFIQAAIGF